MKQIDIFTNGEHSRAIADGECTWCGKPTGYFRDALSIKEHLISGFCQECQDATFKEEEDDDGGERWQDDYSPNPGSPLFDEDDI